MTKIMQINHDRRLICYTGGPCYIQETGIKKIDSESMNLHLKRPRMTHLSHDRFLRREKSTKRKIAAEKTLITRSECCRIDTTRFNPSKLIFNLTFFSKRAIKCRDKFVQIFANLCKFITMDQGLTMQYNLCILIHLQFLHHKIC
jgi:hypothetical protein